MIVNTEIHNMELVCGLTHASTNPHQQEIVYLPLILAMLLFNTIYGAYIYIYIYIYIYTYM